MAEPVALESRGVGYWRSGLALLHRFSITVDRGEVLLLAGPPGSGVNTGLRVLGGELVPEAGLVLVDGVPTAGVAPCTPDPRLVAHGPERAAWVLGDPGTASILLLDRPLAGLDLLDAHDLLGLARRRADEGAAVVLTTDEVRIAADYVDTVALVVAGRLLASGPPATVLHPALRVLRASVGITRW